MSPAATTSPSRKKRRPYRREQIMNAAIELFHERGYHATGMDDIGAAAGITGPGIYRHFRNKEAILETAVRETATQELEEVREIVDGSPTSREAVERLVDNLVGGLADNPAFAAVALHERRNLSKETRSWVDRAERQYVETWVGPLMQVRSDLGDGEARMMVRAIQGMCLTVAQFRTGLPPQRVADLLRSMVMSSLLANDNKKR